MIRSDPLQMNLTHDIPVNDKICVEGSRTRAPDDRAL